MKRLIAGIAIIGGIGALVILAGAARQADPAAAQSGADGAAVYADNCAVCHQADGAGIAGVFPPLANNPNVADGAYVEKVILEGLSGSVDILGETYNSSMPPFSLEGSDLSALVSYVQSLAGAAETTADAPAPAPVAAGADGASVYADNCAGCHQPDGSGVSGVFPPLADNPNAADAAYVERVIREGLSGPIEVLGETYDSSMPPFPLSDSDMAAVVAHVQSLAGGEGPSDTTAAPSDTTAAPVALSGDVERGEKLFAGSVGFENRGPACHACHAAGPLGLRGGSGLGPDLTDVATRLGGEAGLGAWLTNPGSATMQPLFADKELTSSEAADVAAYLVSIQSESPAGGFDRLLFGGLLGLAILLLFMGAVIRRPKETYTDRLRSQS